MGAVIVAFKAVAPLFLAIFAGAVFSRAKDVNENWIAILNKYALSIGFPALIIVALMNVNFSEHEILKLVIVNSVNIVFLIFLAFIVSSVFKLDHNLKRTLILVLPFTNNAYLGMPVLQNAYGEAVMPYAAIISATYLFWMFTLALFLLEITGEGKVHYRKIAVNLLTNPMLLAVAIGSLIGIFQIKLPVFIESTIRMFAESVTAIVLFSLGIFLGLHKAGTLKEWRSAAFWSVLTMLVFPLILFLIAKQLKMDELQFRATIIDAAMPLGLTPYALSTQYKLHTPMVARIVVFATLLSLIAIPFWIVILG